MKFMGPRKDILYKYIGTKVFEELPCNYEFSFFVEMLIQYKELIYIQNQARNRSHTKQKHKNKSNKMSNADPTSNRG